MKYQVHFSLCWKGADGTGTGNKRSPQPNGRIVEADSINEAQIVTLREVMASLSGEGESDIIVCGTGYVVNSVTEVKP